MNSQVTLTASPNSGSVFGGWSGDCSGTNTTCTLTMNSNKSVTAIFNSSGGGPTPSSSPGGGMISCCDYCRCQCEVVKAGSCRKTQYWAIGSVCVTYDVYYNYSYGCRWEQQGLRLVPVCTKSCSVSLSYSSYFGGSCPNTCPSSCSAP